MSRYTNTLIILTLVFHKSISLIEKHKEHFIFEDYPLNDTIDCVPITKEQFYLNIRNDNETYLTKVECIPENLEINNYFPKCCPPNQIYHVKYHKCIESNLTNIYDDFGDGNLLIRSDLSDCKVILDHVSNNQSNFLINSDRSLNFQNKSYKLGSYCLDNAYGDGNFVVRTCEDVSVCKDNGVKCIKKCCPDGQYYKGSTCQSGHDFGISLKDMTRYHSKNEDFNAFLISESCSRYMDKSNLKFHITEDGTTVIRELGVWTQYDIEETYHCVEYIQRVKDYKLLLCKIPPHVQNPVRVMLKRVAMSISCICLLLTLLGYIFIPDLKNLVGKIIVCYCSCLMIAFASLTYLQFDKTTRGEYCDVFGFIVAFFFLAAFSWMTVMSYEMWRVLGSMNARYTGKAHTHKKRFIVYNIIGWSIPMVIIIFTLFDYWYYFLPNALHITVGYVGCVFENNRSRGMYGYIFHFGIPCGIYLLTNFVIFVKTIRYIYQVKNQIEAIKIQDGQEKRKKWMILNTDKERLKMVIRIFLVMGVNFSFEVFSSIIDFHGNAVLEHVELIFDAINGLQGMFIFCIFLMKKKIWKSLREKLNLAGSRSSMVTCSTEEMMIQRH